MAEAVVTQARMEQPDARALGALLAALGPLLAWITSASAYPPAASGERLLAAGLSIAPAQAPGHPIAGLGVALCALLVPLGPSALRAAVASGLFAAIGAAALYRAIDDSLGGRQALRAQLRSPIALACSWLAFGCAPLLGAETSAAPAGAAIGCCVLQRLCAFELAWPQLALRPLREAGLWWSLLAVEQPALAAVLLAVALPTLVRVLRGYTLPAANLIAPLLFAPLLAFGALRAGARDAAPYASAAGLAELGAAFAIDLHPPRMLREIAAAHGLGPSLLFALALAGVLLAWRGDARRRIAALWSLAWLAPLAASAALARSSALDAFTLCAAAGLSALGLARLLGPSARGRLAVGVALSGCALALVQLQVAGRELRAGDEAAADAIAGAARRDLPPRATLLLAPELAKAWFDGEREERVRPDVLLAEKPWRLDLPAARRRAERQPELQPLLRADLLRAGGGGAAGLPLVELQALAARRPLLLELEPLLERDLYPMLVPFSLYHQFSTSPVGRADLQLARRDSDERWQKLYAALLLPALDGAPLQLLRERLAAEHDFAAAVADKALAAGVTERAAQLP